MNLVEFNKKLEKIDFRSGSNIDLLENYLLACLAQLEAYKDQKPTYDLFLTIFDQARNGERVAYDAQWLHQKESNADSNTQNSEVPAEWLSLRDDLRSIAADLVNTREVRSRPDITYVDNPFDWTSENGTRYYNGTSPASILLYGATRFEGEYPPAAYEESKVGWHQFAYPIRIGISYE